MPFDRARPLSDAGTVGVGAFDTPDPAFLDTLGAAFRQDNLIGSALTNVQLGMDTQALTKVDPNYNVYQDPDFSTFVQESPDDWDDVYNRTAADARRSQIEKERKDRATLSAAGWTGVGASFVAGVADPTILIPGGALVRGGGAIGFSALRSAASVGAMAAAATGLQEAGLQATQETRTVAESAIAIGGSAILGGLIGAGASRFLSAGEWTRVGKQIETDLVDEGVQDAVGITDTIVKRMQSAGAAAVDDIKLDDLGVGGPKAAQIVARATAAARLNPGIETMFSPSVKVRETYSRMVDNPVYTTMQMEGRSLGSDVENLVKQYQRGALADWLESSRNIYRDARKAGYTGSKTEFYQSVAKAGRRGDVDPGGNEFITRAAQEARSKVFDPLLERAQKNGLLPDDVKVSTAASYVTRLWNREKLIGEETRFKQVARDYFTNAVKQQVDSLTSAKDNRVGRLQSVVADLELPSDQRAALLQTLPDELKSLRETNPAFVQTDEELSGLRSQLYQAREANDRTKTQALSAQVDAVTTKAGRDYADYVTKRNVLQSRIGRIRNNVVGRASQIEAMQARIGDIEAANIERLRRLHRSLSNVDDGLERASPELLAEKLSKARTQFAQVLERSAKAQDRLAKVSETTDDAGKVARAEGSFDLAESRRIDEANELADRIGDLEKVNPEEAIVELRNLIESRLYQASDIVARENAKVIELSKKIDAANPKLVTDRIKVLQQKITDAELDFNERVFVGMDGQNDFTDYVNDIVNGVFNNLTGRGKGDIPEWIVPATRGPLKERSFNIPDELVEDFLENDMEAIMRRYSRTMAAEVELTEKFGRADLQDQLKEIEFEYNDLRAAAKTDEERQRLTKAEAKDVKNLQAFRDLIRGTYRSADESSEWSKITRAALTWNYIRLLGGVTLASLTDASRFVGVHGVRATMREALPALVKNVRAAQISKSDAKALGAVTERVLQSRLASLADLNDPYAHGSRYERFLSNASNAFSRATGLGWWNDTLKSVSSVMTQNRMMRNALDWNGADKYEKAYMAYLGIDEDMAQRVSAQFRKHGIEEDGIYGANVSQWDDEAAARAWGAALNKDVDRTIITKGVADQPLWTRTNVGKLVTQFKSFGLASHQRVLIAGLQERPHRLAEMMVMSSALGMMIGYLKYVERGDIDEANRLLDNPGLWVAEGLDRSGILSIPFEISNTAEKLGMPGFVTAAQAIAGDKDAGGQASRYASRGKLGAVLGPSAGLFEDIATIAQQLSEADLKKSGANAIIRQLPGATLPGIRTAIHAGVKPAIEEAYK